MELFGPTRGENYKSSLFTIMTFQKVSLPFERPPHQLLGLKTTDKTQSVQIIHLLATARHCHFVFSDYRQDCRIRHKALSSCQSSHQYSFPGKHSCTSHINYCRFSGLIAGPNIHAFPPLCLPKEAQFSWKSSTLRVLPAT